MNQPIIRSQPLPHLAPTGVSLGRRAMGVGAATMLLPARVSAQSGAPADSAMPHGAVGDRVRECWTKDAGALDRGEMSMKLIVRLRPGGVPAEVTADNEGMRRMNANPRLRAFFERARSAILNSKCSPLPLPADKLNTAGQLTFVFKP